MGMSGEGRVERGDLWGEEWIGEWCFQYGKTCIHHVSVF